MDQVLDDGNIFVSDLGERFITQIGQGMADVHAAAPHGIQHNFTKAISRSKHGDAARESIDDMFFCPHYPYPPAGRRAHIGMQHASYLTTFVHATHFLSPGEPVYSLSTSVELPVYRVMLWRNNPFHIYSGYVEASITHGRPSQPGKAYGAEHPMWLVNGHNKVSADRAFKMSVGWIDTFFDEFIPHFQHFMRGNVLGWAAADTALAADKRQGYEVARASAGSGGGASAVAAGAPAGTAEAGDGAFEV